MIASGGLFGDFVFVLFFVGDFVVEILRCVGVDVEKRFFQQERFATENAVLEVYQSFGVESPTASYYYELCGLFFH